MSAHITAMLDDLEERNDGPCRFRAVRHHLGITSFGAVAWTAQEAGDRLLNDLDPDDPTSPEELFLVLRGKASFEIDGDRVDAPAGTLVSVPPGTQRSAAAELSGTTVLAIEGVPGLAYVPRGWELWAPLVPLYEAGEYAEVGDQLRRLVARSPQYGVLFYNLACCESLTGRPTQAVEHLRQAVDREERLRTEAAQDPDLVALRDEPGFQELIGT